jgi:hypothetical protein
MRPRSNALLAAAVVAAVLDAGLAAQAPGVHPISGRRYAPVMGYQGAPWLERSEREEEEAPDVALDVLKIAARYRDFDWPRTIVDCWPVRDAARRPLRRTVLTI